MRILIGLSGGVDSSVAAFLLKEQGYEVVGAMMSICQKDKIPIDTEHKNSCLGTNEQEKIDEARKIANQLDIPFHVIDCTQKYKEIVLNNFKSEYLEGRTPNPCVWCNAYVKFGVFPELAKASGIEFDKFATGHYSKIEEKDGLFYLKKGIAEKKDQSYFLYRLRQDQLKDIIMPLGGYTKEEIRKIALENNLLSATKPDSQDFYAGDYNDILGIKEQIGNIVDSTGKVLGKHKGFWNYTIGQRKGIGIAAKEPLYVLELNKERNEVIVGFANETFKNELNANDINMIIPIEKGTEIEVMAKIRSTQQPQPAIIYLNEDNTIKTTFKDYQKSIAIGQSIVFYQNDIVLGGGIIDKIL